MEKEQHREWLEAQKIVVSVDLIAAAKNQLKFLATIDRNRYLYEGATMEWAIYRYNVYWLPLLAKHLENPISDDPLVVPLDCEWVWHCHKLNPSRYKSDCEKLFGRLLGNNNIISTTQGTSKSKTKEIWNTMYPEEPYELDQKRDLPVVNYVQNNKFTSYDLASAVRRQISFYYQVSRAHVFDTLFLEEALTRYKGFLHLIRTNRKKNINFFCVPTYDVDLMWHSHQTYPVSYCNDLMKLVGKVLEHDDTDSDRTKGNKLDTGFSRTTKLWQDTFGLSYWKAGAMYRGTPPTPVTQIPLSIIDESKKFHAPDNFENLISFPATKVVEVLLEFVEIKNLPDAYKGDIYVSLSKKQPDMLFKSKRRLTILSESKEKQVACFNCEPTGEFIFELMCLDISNLPSSKSHKTFGSCSLSFEECLASKSKLFVNKWVVVVPISGITISKPIVLHVSLSFTPPTQTPVDFHLLQPDSFFKGSYLSSLSEIEKVKLAKGHTYVTDGDGNEVLNLQMRDYSKEMSKNNNGLLKEVVHVKRSGEMHTLAEFQGNEWFIMGIHGPLKLQRASRNDGHLFELLGNKMVRLFVGKKLDYEPKQCEDKRNEQDFMTAIDFSAEYPYGRAIALIDFKHGTFKVIEEWMTLSGITLTFILSDILRRQSCFYPMVAIEDDMLYKGANSSSPIFSLTITEAIVGHTCDGVHKNMSKDDKCGGNCGSQCVATMNMSSCGGGSCSGGGGGKCGGGKCSGSCGNMAMSNSCGDTCVDFINMANCGGGDNCGHSGNCNSGGSCGNIAKNKDCVDSLNMANCGGGGNCGHSGNCSSGGSCGNIAKNKYCVDSINMANCGGGGNCGHSGNCSSGGSCGNIAKNKDFVDSLNMANCGGGGNCGHSGNCSSGGSCGNIAKNKDFVDSLNMTNYGGGGNCGHSGNCSSGGSCGNIAKNKDCVDSLNMANCGGGRNCGHSGNCSSGGSCGNIVKNKDFVDSLNMANCGGGGNCGHSGNCSSGGSCGNIVKNKDCVDYLNMANCGGGGNCGHSGNCSSGGSCGNVGKNGDCVIFNDDDDDDDDGLVDLEMKKHSVANEFVAVKLVTA